MRFQSWSFVLLAALSRVQSVAFQMVGDPNSLEFYEQEENYVGSQFHRRLACKSKPLPEFEPSVESETVVSFIALGDTPYNMRDRYCLNHQLRNMDLSQPGGPKFAIHVGDIKASGPRIPCDERLYSDISDIFTHPTNNANYDKRDLLFVVGDNEWSDCWRPDDAWQLWMRYFGPNNKHGFGTLSDDSIKVHRQWKVDGMDRSENFAFFTNGVLFIGVNIVGGRERGDESVRLVQNFKFVRSQLKTHSTSGMKAVIIMGHGVLKPGFHYTYFANDLFALLRNKYRDLPVAYLHGDGHEYCVRYPAPDLNYVDLMVDEGGFANPIQVSVLRDPATDEHIFAVDRRGGLYSPNGTSADIPDCPRIEEVTWNVTLPPEEPPENDLTWKGLNPTNLLSACEGNCVDDTSCGPGLKCMIRKRFEPVPGCTGKGKKGKAYCYDETLGNDRSTTLSPTTIPTASPTSSPTSASPTSPPTSPPSLAPTPTPSTTVTSSPIPTASPTSSPTASSQTTPPLELKIKAFPPIAPNSLGVCEGHCKKDEDCQADLYCFKRRKFDPVPGCSGTGRRDKDYCIPRDPPLTPSIETNPPSAPPSGSPTPVPTTMSTVPPMTSNPPTSAPTGVSTSPLTPELVTYKKFSSPLGLCEGDCDNDEECREGLVCFKRKGLEKVTGCQGDGVDGKDYCVLGPKANSTPLPATSPPTSSPTPLPTAPPSLMPTDPPTNTPSAPPTLSPTPVPTIKPTPLPAVPPTTTIPPTQAPTLQSNSMPELVTFKKVNSPLGLCQGDCDNDAQCQDGLVCFKRPGLEGVPGCSGTGQFKLDYCILDPKANPTPATPSPTPAPGQPGILRFYGNPRESPDKFPLGACEADCDSNDDCQSGLVCMYRKGDEPVPGCSGQARRKKDYCYDPNWRPSSGTSAPTPLPTSLPATPPTTTNPPTPIPTQTRTTPSPTSKPTLGPTPFPTRLPTRSPTPLPTLSPTPLPTRQPTPRPTPLPLVKHVSDGGQNYGVCEGDCDSDRDCRPGLICFQRDGTEPPDELVPGCSGIPRRSWDFCIVRPSNLLDTVGDNGDPRAAFPLGECEGDCDFDSDCEPGLRCFQRGRQERVPGCTGAGSSGKDYCYVP